MLTTNTSRLSATTADFIPCMVRPSQVRGATMKSGATTVSESKELKARQKVQAFGKDESQRSQRFVTFLLV